MTRFNGKIMSRDIVVANVKDGVVSVVNNGLAPLYFSKSSDFEGWLSSRAIDEHRTHSRLLKKVLRLREKDDVSTVLSVHAATITDTYWFCPENEQLSWEDVRFKENYFANLALKGSFDAFNLEPSRTPELTNIGSYEKCWIQEDGKWWMYKTGTNEEFFSELFIYKLGEKLGFDMAHYELSNGYIRSLDFTNNGQYNLEPMSSLIFDDDDYDSNFNLLYSLSPSFAEAYLKMIYLDTICMNVDRHTKNYGLLKDSVTGEIIKLAPNFDNNIALISKDVSHNISRVPDGFITGFFVPFIENNPVANEMLRKLDIPKITVEMVNECIDEIPIKVDVDYVRNFILNGQQQIEKHLGFTPLSKRLENATQRSVLTDSLSKNDFEVDKEM